MIKGRAAKQDPATTERGVSCRDTLDLALQPMCAGSRPTQIARRRVSRTEALFGYAAYDTKNVFSLVGDWHGFHEIFFVTYFYTAKPDTLIAFPTQIIAAAGVRQSPARPCSEPLHFRRGRTDENAGIPAGCCSPWVRFLVEFGRAILRSRADGNIGPCG